MACRPRRINITESASRLTGAGAEATRARQRKLPRPLSFCDRICYTGNHLKLGVLILYSLTYLLYISVTGLYTAFIHVAYIEHGF